MFRHTSSLMMIVLVTILLFASSGLADQGHVDLPRHPSISPDGSEIVFSWRGDLWKVSSQGGHAMRLTSHPAHEGRSAWSPDGSRIAFESDRSGYTNLYMMNADGTGVRAMTDLDRPLTLVGFGVDEGGQEVLTLDASIEGDVYRDLRPYMVSTEGGLLRRIHDAFGRHPMVNPEGRLVAFTRGGSSWDRRHYRGSDARNVWIYDREADTFDRLTTWQGNDGRAKWAGPRTLVFTSDRQLDTVNLYQMTAEHGEEMVVQLTSFDDRDIWDFDVSADGSTVILVKWDTLYRLDLQDPNQPPVALTVTASDDEGDNFELRNVNRSVNEAALSPDGKVMAVAAYGEIFITGTEEDSPTRRVTNTHARAKEIAWSPDGLKLYFVMDEDGTDSIYAATVAMTRSQIRDGYAQSLAPADDTPDQDDDPDAEPADAEDDGPDPSRWHDAWSFNIEPVIVSAHNDTAPRPSPDGTMLAFKRGNGDLMIHELTDGSERLLVPGWDRRMDWRWSPDSRWIAYHQNDINFNSDVWIMPADGSRDPVNISRHPANDYNPRWSADGKILIFISQRIAREYDVWAVYLDRELEGYLQPELDAYYAAAAEEAKKRKPLPVNAEVPERGPLPELDLDDAYLRLRRITTLSGSEWNNEITPAGDRIVFTGNDGSAGLFSVKWDGSDRRRLSGSVSVQHLSLTGDRVVYVSGSRAGTVPVTGGTARNHDISTTIRIDLQAQSSQKFLDAARFMGEIFYHPTMKDLDWQQITDDYHQLARQTRTPDEFNYIANLMLGELNASHMGIRTPVPSSPVRQTQGRLGIRYEPVEGGYRVTEVIPGSPAATGPMQLQVGDVITSINMEAFGPTDTVESKLTGRVGEETVISIRRTLDDGRVVDVPLLMTPISYGAEVNLQYDAWQRRNAELVHEWSGGRLGYLHIRGMNTPALYEFERDLYAAGEGRDGLLIDVRNNGGGSTADLVLSSIMVREHAYTIPRGADPEVTGGYPQDRLYIQRWVKPVNMLCNEKSFSNAEIISHAFKTLGRGTLVGQETYGGVISTGSYTLIDGTTVRQPFRGWFLPDGTDMENNGAVPDIIVTQTPELEAANDDAQLRAAVEDLMQRLD